MQLNSTTGRLIIAMALCAVGVGGVAMAGPFAPAPIVFNTPAENDRGSMCLGNGEVAALAWVSKDGTLHTVLQRSDCWNEAGQHVKIGGLDYVTGRPIDAGTMVQELSVAKGTFDISWKSAGKAVRVHYRIQQGADLAVCRVEGGLDVQAKMVNPHVYPEGVRSFSSDQLGMSCQWRGAEKNFKAFDLASDVVVPNGWCHVNRKETIDTILKWCDYWQATAECGSKDFLHDRAFGCLTRREVQGNTALFLSAVTCWQPCATVAEWTKRTQSLLDQKGWTLAQEGERLAYHLDSWNKFWDRSHIAVTPRVGAGERVRKVVPINSKLPLSFGRTAKGEYPWAGKLENVRLTYFGAQSALTPDKVPSSYPLSERGLANLANGFKFTCRLELQNPQASQRILDNITSGGSDGFLVDVVDRRVRVILGKTAWNCPTRLTAGKPTDLSVEVTPQGEVSVTLDGSKDVFRVGVTLAEECRAVSSAWANVRYMTRCVGQGNLPIRFNGSLFTASQNGNMDARNWGHGYWWQNTRLPYYAMFAAGDVEMTDPLFRLYIDRLLEFNQKRTRKHLGHGGAYFPECLLPWGDHFPHDYGTSMPWAKRTNKLQNSHWHKYEWVGQLELAWLLLERYAYTEDAEWFKRQAPKAIRSYVEHFEAHYPKGADGKYVMYPAQALETYHGCTNAMPEVAGLNAVLPRLVALPKGLLSEEDRAFYAKMLQAVPTLPTRKLANGEEVFAPAQKRSTFISNCETPELYTVHPFRLCSFEKPNAEMGRRTYAVRPYKLYFGWAQDELYAARLGMTEEAREHLVDRVVKHCPKDFRWPAYWGPNFNCIPDMDECSIIQNIPQEMLLQCDGRKLFLLPAWPKDWNCDFKLHAPFNTTLEGKVVDGKLKDLVVTPAARRADVTLCE